MLFLCTVLFAALCSCTVNTDDAIEVRNAWSPAMPPGSSVIAVYAEITAHRSDTLLSAATPVAAIADMHATVEQGGMMHMQPLAGLSIAAGQTVLFAPGGKHIMLSGVRQVLPVGSQFPLTLRFAVAGEITVKVDVVAPGARS